MALAATGAANPADRAGGLPDPVMPDGVVSVPWPELVVREELPGMMRITGKKGGNAMANPFARLAGPVTVVLVALASSAQANDEVILESCKADLQLSDSGCACVLDKVHSELSDKQLAFFVAAISKNQPAMMQAQMALTGAEMMEVATFMTATPQTCQNQ